ncbi:hypothetical protein QQX98_005899 [Neonectria punicea]|uniref:Uncharacterized protein n=1 Tax=Neonectria punicea TaxID=979145 RepID=A0ABR1H2V4_9HYPO
MTVGFLELLLEMRGERQLPLLRSSLMPMIATVFPEMHKRYPNVAWDALRLERYYKSLRVKHKWFFWMITTPDVEFTQTLGEISASDEQWRALKRANSRGMWLKTVGHPRPELYHHVFTGSPKIPTAADPEAVAAMNLLWPSAPEEAAESGDVVLPNPQSPSQILTGRSQSPTAAAEGIAAPSPARPETDETQNSEDAGWSSELSVTLVTPRFRKRRRSPSSSPSVESRHRPSNLQHDKPPDVDVVGLAESTNRLVTAISKHTALMEEANANSQSSRPPESRDAERAMRDGRDTFHLKGVQLLKFMKAMTQPWMAVWWNLCRDDIEAKEALLADIMGDQGAR